MENSGHDGERKTTVAEPYWRENADVGRSTTTADSGWREKMASGRQATVGDAGWRKAGISDGTKIESVLGSVTSNAILNKESMIADMEKITEFVSSEGNKYVVTGILSKEGGEALIFLCDAPTGEKVVAKLYYGLAASKGAQSAARKMVFDYMQTEEGRMYTVPVEEYGLTQIQDGKFYFEIMPFCPEGDLFSLGELSFDEIVDVVRQLNDALHSIHKAGILHRDISPENIYLHDGKILLGDFGIATIAQNGVSTATETLMAKDGYAAPELRLGLTNRPTFIYSEKCDYYSFGVTIASLFEGHFVYNGMNDAIIQQAVISSRIPLIRQDKNRPQLEKLINGLCMLDPQARFGYEEVNEWLNNHNYSAKSASTVSEEGWIKPIDILHESCDSERSLFEAITKDKEHWDEGIQLLYDKTLENYFKNFVSNHTALARAARQADEKYHGGNKDLGLFIFLKALYPPGPIVWKGHIFSGLPKLGNNMSRTEKPTGYGAILKNQIVSHWLENTEGISVDQKTLELVKKIEEYANKEPEIACFWFGFSFAEKRVLKIGDWKIETQQELYHAFFGNAYRFYEKQLLDVLMDRKKSGAPIYGFLYSYGYQELVEKAWKEIAAKNQLFDKACLIFAMFDGMAEKAGISSEELRRFFVCYGPIGGYVFTQRLLKDQSQEIYKALDAKGSQLLEQIKNQNLNVKQSIEKIYAEHIILAEKVQRMRSLMTDNPYCLEIGVYEQKGILCANLMGTFAFRLYGIDMPLGFEAYIKRTKGGDK